jgi:hypothetical protein
MCSKKINNTYELWTFLKNEGGFDAKGYDKDMFDELMHSFKMYPEHKFETALKKQQIKQEEFIVNFFQLLQPFSLMISNILALFEKNGIKQSNKNIEISFDSSLVNKKLSFNISNFIEYQEIVKKVICAHEKHIANIGKFTWEMWEIYRNRITKETQIPEFLKWKEVYEKGIVIPEAKFEWIPSSKDKDFDKLISEIFDVWNTVKDILQSIAPTKEERKSIYSKRSSPYQPILQNETDYWLQKALEKIFAMARDYSGLDKKEQTDICDKLNEILQKLDKKTYTKEVSAKSLQEVLKLPVWKHRYEVYSIWIFSQIIEALDGTLNVNILNKDGELCFSFPDSKLALINNLQLWSELRTKCIVKPISKERKCNIQPDYSIITEDTSSSILVIECKQYKKQSVKNFSEAIIDYANNRPNAKVFLVNYGPMIKESILSRVGKSLNKDDIGRISLFKELRPNSQENIDFRKAVKKCIYQYIYRDFIFTEPASFELKWNASPRDLDIHLFFVSKEGEQKILNYKEKQIPYANITEDITSGFGPETIKVDRWEEGVYYLSVHNFSEDSPLADCGGKLTISVGESKLEYTCQETGMGNWWNILKIDTINRTFSLINKIEDDSAQSYA